MFGFFFFPYVSQQMNERTNENERTNKQTNERAHKRTNEKIDNNKKQIHKKKVLNEK